MIDELKQKLQAEVERLNHEINFVLPKEIERARAHGDLRENSEYKAALERQQFVTSRLSHLRLRLSKLSSVQESDIPRDRVGFGSRVTVQDVDTKKRETYALTLGEFIEGDDDGAETPVSMASPLGKALLGAKVGQSVTTALPMGQRRLKIVELETVHDLAGKRPSSPRRNTSAPLGLAEPARRSRVIPAPATCSPAFGNGTTLTIA